MKKNLILSLFLLLSIFYIGFGKIIYINDVKNPDKITLFRDKVVVSHRTLDSSFSFYDGTKWIHYSPEDIKRMFDDSVYLSKFGFLWPKRFQFDSKGNIWFATSKAICKFDGEKITPYYTFLNWEKTDTFHLDVPIPLHFGTIRAFTLDNFDNPWVVVSDTARASIDHLFKFEDGIFREVSSFQFNSRGGSIAFANDRKSRVWFNIYNSVHIFASWGGLLRKFNLYDLFEDDCFINQICISKSDVKYFLTGGLGSSGLTLYIYDDTSWSRDRFPFYFEWNRDSTIKGFKDGFWGMMRIDSTDNIWILSDEGSPNLLKRTPKGEWFVYQFLPPDTVPFPWEYFDFQIDYQGRIWIVRRNGLIYIFDPNDVDAVEGEIIEGLPDVWVRKLYPNPATEFARIEFFLHPDFSEQFTAGLYNYFGYKVMDLKPYFSYEPKSASGVIQFPVRGLPPGLYFVTLSAGNSHYARKLIIAE